MFQSTFRLLNNLQSFNRSRLAFAVALSLLTMGRPSANSQTPYPDWTIYSPYVDLRISASASHAGAITSLKYRGVEIVNNYDHGRQIQSSLSLNGKFECYNPNEAGTLDDQDFPWSTSELLGLAIPSSNRLMTTTDMAYWWIRSGTHAQPCAVPYSNIPPDGQFSQFWLQKDVTISPPNMAANVVEYLNTYGPSATTPPEQVTSNDGTVSAWLTPNFTSAWTYDLATRNLLQNQEPSGADDTIKVLKWPNSPIGELTFALYSPENLQPWEGHGFTWALPSVFGGVAVLWTNNPTTNALPQSYRTYMAIGNSTELKSALDSVHLRYAYLDPDVYTWREYLALNPDLGPYIQGDPQRWLRDHWISNGIAEGRTASYRFASVPYRNLNSDLWNRSYLGVMEHYIEWGRKEGRTSAPRATGGIQHTIVRSPQQDFVYVRGSGGNASGQLGNNSTTRTASPVQLPNFGGQRVTDVAAGSYTSLAVLANGTVWMWGSNQYGARGNGTVGGQNNVPVQVPNLPSIVVPSTKDRHVVAASSSAYAVVDNDGKVWTWGAGWSGQLGSGNTNARYTPGKVQKASGGDLTGILSISIGQSQMAALDVDGHVWTWGSNQSGALGTGIPGDSALARPVVANVGGPPMGGLTQVVAGGSSFCLALARDGHVWAWGNNGSGQLGRGNTVSSPVAIAVTNVLYPSPFGIDKITAGAYHAMAHSRTTGRVYGWGYNGWGQLGLPPGSPVNNPTPTALPVSDGTTSITDLAAGAYFSLLIRSNGGERKIFGVGDNQAGQLGVNDYVTRTSPTLSSF